MTSKQKSNVAPGGAGEQLKLTLTRTFAAPRELLWAAWTEREHMLHWFCPRDFTVLFADADLRPGGAWRAGMRAPDGSEYIEHGTYREIDAPSRLVFTHAWEKNESEPAGVETLITITFAEPGQGQTLMTFEQVGFATAGSRDGHEQGWGEAFDNLARHATAAQPASDSEILLTRVFDAPRRLVWQAWTEADQIAQWWGPANFSTRVEALDFRPGGRWRYVMIGPDGAEYPAEGTFREIVPFEHIVSTDEFPGDFEHPEVTDLPAGIVATTIFEDIGDKTRITVRIAHPNAEERAKHEAMGVVGGFESMFDCFADHLAGQDPSREGANA
ncbi:MAG: SRPBCC family protein [Phycisphaeraceae bacterium]